MDIQKPLHPEDDCFRFYLTNNQYLEFTMGAKFKDLHLMVYTEGFFCGPSQRIDVVYFSPLYEPMWSLHKGLKESFSGKRIIKPELFQNGLGYYFNFRNAYTDADGCFFPDIDTRYPLPSLDSIQDLTLWSSPTGSAYYQTWMYTHEERVYLEMGRFFDGWNDKTEEEEQFFREYMRNYSFERFEVTRELAQDWIDYLFEGAQYSYDLNESLYRYVLNSWGGNKNLS